MKYTRFLRDYTSLAILSNFYESIINNLSRRNLPDDYIINIKLLLYSSGRQLDDRHDDLGF